MEGAGNRRCVEPRLYDYMVGDDRQGKLDPDADGPRLDSEREILERLLRAASMKTVLTFIDKYTAT